MANEVVDWKTQMENEARAAAAVERPTLQMVSLRSGILQLNKQPVPKNILTCVVVGSAHEHRWFDRPFDPDNLRNPSCFALSISGEDMAAHAEAKDPQSKDGCQLCPMFQWGSDPKPNSRGKACKDVRRLVLIPVSALQDSGAKAEMAILNIPVTSVKQWANYVNALASQFARPPWGVITEITTRPHAKNQFEVLFNASALVADDMLPVAKAKADEAVPMLLAGYEPPPDDVPAPEKQPPAAKGKSKF